MQTIPLHEAEEHLAQLLEQAANGKTFVISEAGKPLARISPIKPKLHTSRLGFMSGQISVPPDFDSMGSEYLQHSKG